MNGPALQRYFGLTLKQWLLLVVVLPGLPFVLTSLFILLYSTTPWPTGAQVILPEIKNSTEELILLVHGKGDSPSSWADGFATELNSRILSDRQQAVAIDWGAYSNDLFRSTLNARRIGHALGAEIARRTQLKKLHLIGHSAGSFVVFGICEAVKEKGSAVPVQTTYLDPVGIYAGVDWWFGPRNFGSCANISDAYIDTEDGVPGSNAPLTYPHTFDVTALRKKSGFAGLPHLWPIAYYRQAVVEHRLPYWQPEAEVLGKFPPRQSSVLQ